MPRPVRVLLPILVLGGVLAAGLYWYGQRTGAALGRSLTLYGNVEVREAALAFPISGRLARIPAEEGDRVATGDLLAVLEQERFRQRVAEAEGQVAAQRERFLKLQRGTRPQEIRRAEANVQAAGAEAENARRRLNRLQGLADKQFVPPQSLDDAAADVRATRARLNAAREALDLAREGPRPEDIAAARAHLEALEAALARHRQDLTDTELRAPVAGVVRERLMEPGEVAGPQSPVLSLAQRDRVWVRAFLPEPQLGRVAPGMAATIRTDSHPDREFAARVGHISPTAEFTPKTVQTTEVRPDLVYRVRINACEPYDALRLGMPVTVTIRGPGDDRDARSDPCP